MNRPLLLTVIATVAVLGGGPLAAAPGDQPVQPLPPSTRLADDKQRVRSTTLPARGLFVGDKLSDRARERLGELIVDASDLNVEVALLVPTGPWQIDGSGAGERDLTPARLQSLRRFLTERGVDPKRVFVESRIDEKIAEPQLTLQMVGRPAAD
ncbi:MAG: hypothetical protein KBF65_10155 [Rubrivivax sp.]|jgi:OOP family OmpA-OmpF porin|nr:hypothetical protein [Betaproteobacteria bacterium]MBP6317924.1 hypothetical protein [Rubrivivax sp.]MBK7278668.1 hypothetical protein [Betaproteobacteria bacterium]MBK7459767.1 hypothetical protein [Betaproteobacteria bacterium]MBK7517616.1 hypothetical protein [Betaproteobacteria bacterium]